MVDVQEIGNRIVSNVERVIIGKRPEVQLTVLGLLSQGHILIEDVPGVGKPFWPNRWHGQSAARSSESSLRLICCPRISLGSACLT
jgi:hypothetical protein